jgi:hypothetical protein
MNVNLKVPCVLLSIVMLSVMATSERMDWLPVWGKVIISVLWLFVTMWIIGGEWDAE